MSNDFRFVVPQLVYATKNPGDEKPEDLVRIQDKFRALPAANRKKMGFEIAEPIIRKIGTDFQLDLSKLADIARAVRSYFFAELKLENFPEHLVHEMGVSIEIAQRITTILNQEILQKKVNEDIGATVRIPVLQAMSDYPNLGQQNITDAKIKVKNQPEPVRGSLSNWIHYYRDELGIGFHDQVARGKFLFQSENGKRLTGEERERLNLILKSIEEEFPVTIDTGRQMIVFPTATASAHPIERAMPKPMTAPPTAPSFAGVSRTPTFTARGAQPSMPALEPRELPRTPKSDMSRPLFGDAPSKNIADETLHFSTGHVLPTEKTTPPVSPTAYRGGEGGIQKSPPVNRGTALRSPYTIRPMRQRNDEERES